MMEGFSTTEVLAVGTAIGSGVATIIAAVANSVVNLRKQPFEQAMIMVGALQARVDALAKANERCQEQHAEQQLELGQLREEVSYLRRELEEKNAKSTDSD